jgi:hypothetical protein
MKKIIAVLVAALSFGLASPSNAVVNSSSMSSYLNFVEFNKVYAEQILLCDSRLRLSAYQNAVFFDNNGSCIDPSPIVLSDGSLEQWLNQMYPGGMNQWTVTSSSGKSCVFELIQLHPHPNEVLVWETFFTACAVKLNEEVNTNWSMEDTGSPVSPVFTGCTSPELVGMHDNCLDVGWKAIPNGGGNMTPGTVDYINGAAKLLKKKFYFDFKAWVVYNKKLKNIRTTFATSPEGTKIYLQKWVDYKWVTVRTFERLWEGKTSFDYKLTSSGKYRITARSVTGKIWKSRPITV